MEFDVHRVSLSCYPRVQHAIKYLSPLSRRFDLVKNECSLMKYYPQIINTDYNFSEFFLCIQITDKDAPLVIQNVLVRNERCVKLGKNEIDEVIDLVQSHSGAYFLLILNENENEDVIPKSDRVKTVVVTENVEQESKTAKSCNGTHNKNDSLKSEISDIMEESVYEAFEMRRKCEQLGTVLKNIETESAKQKGGLEFNIDIKPTGELLRTTSLHNESRNVKGIRKDPNGQRAKSAGHDDSISDETVPAKRSKSAYERCQIEGFILDILKELTESKNLKSASERLLKEQMENIGRLYDEMIGMFCRSRVPKEKRPQTDEISDGTVSDELKKELRKLSLSIRGCGYRCRSFHVFVDDEFDGGQLKPDIERILKNQNCLSPVVISSFSMKPFLSCKVGSNISAEFDNGCSKSGTLGGFGNALSDEGNKTIGVTSRHVVTDNDGKRASTLKVSENDANAEVLVDRSIRERRENVLDIAAVSFENCDIDLNTKYKTSEESLASGKITNLTREGMKGLPVHICGSETPVGYGTITMPKIDAVQDTAMESFIIVEDRKNPQDDKKPFCAAGDSGAIVCADDQNNPENVQLISMVMGENLEKHGTYCTIDLNHGIQQVEEEIRSRVELL